MKWLLFFSILVNAVLFSFVLVDLGSSFLIEGPQVKMKLRYMSQVHLCAPEEMKSSEFMSQNFFSGNFSGVRYREDAFMDSFIFPRICGGTYLEVGGNDGVWLSNTLWLHKARSWRGVLIEAHPTLFQKLSVNRYGHKYYELLLSSPFILLFF